MYKLENYKKQLLDCALFASLVFEDVLKLLDCMRPVFKSFEKGEVIFAPGRQDDDFGIVLHGMVRGERIDAMGERSVAGAVGQSGVFGEILVGRRGRNTITVVAAKDTLALLIPLQNVLTGCVNACTRHDVLLQNLLGIIGEQFFSQSDRLYFITRKTLRAKIIAYLGATGAAAGDNVFEIPYNREELASYLCADRSALSRELARMRLEGLLEYSGKSFKINFIGTAD